jgi:hypothetical protein
MTEFYFIFLKKGEPHSFVKRNYFDFNLIFSIFSPLKIEMTDVYLTLHITWEFLLNDFDNSFDEFHFFLLLLPETLFYFFLNFRS